MKYKAFYRVWEDISMVVAKRKKEKKRDELYKKASLCFPLFLGAFMSNTTKEEGSLESGSIVAFTLSGISGK